MKRCIAAGSTEGWFAPVEQAWFGAGEWNRTTDLRFTKQWKGVAQVVDDLGNPRPPCGRTSLGFLFLFVSFSRHYSAFVVTVNTYITPERSQGSGVFSHVPLVTHTRAQRCVQATPRIHPGRPTTPLRMGGDAAVHDMIGEIAGCEAGPSGHAEHRTVVSKQRLPTPFYMLGNSQDTDCDRVPRS